MIPQTSNWEFVTAAYTVAWVVILSYLFYVTRRVARARASASRGGRS